MKPTLIPLRTASERLGLSVHCLRKWLRIRRLPHYRMGSRVMLDESDLARFIESNRIPAAEDGKA